MLPPNDSTRANLGQVDFAPGARTVWHTHPAGQLLIVTAGKGWVQEEGRARQDITSGDVVWTPATVRHWHGATATSPMNHLGYYAGWPNAFSAAPVFKAVFEQRESK